MPLQTDSILFDVLSADPGSPVEGQMWFNTTDKTLKVFRTTGGTSAVQARVNVTTTNPLVTSDSASGYAIGSRWINSSTDEEFVCCDATTSAALWKSTTSTTAAAITYFQVSASGDITTTSTSDTTVLLMTLTPGAGTYQVLFSSDVALDVSGTIYLNCYANTTKVTNSERQHLRGPQAIRDMVALTCIATVAAAQTITIRWRVTSGAVGTMGNRSLTLIKVA